MKQLLLLPLLLFGTAFAQQRPAVPDPRLETALTTTVIQGTERARSFDKTLHPPQARKRPVVNDPGLARLEEGIYVERHLVPHGRRAGTDDPEAVRIRRGDR
jgi:hypothetical protein